VTTNTGAPPTEGPTPLTDGPDPALAVAAVLAVVIAGHLSLYPKVADLDGFYHVGHALAYLQGSIFDPSLPWATRSVIGDIGGDLWWGFHVLLMPFAAIGGVALGMQAAAFTLTAMLGFTMLWVLRRHGVAGSGWWAALFLVVVPNIFFRHLMVRPHVVSLAASLALLSVLVRGRWWQVVLLSALVSWVHLSLFWMPPCIAVAYAITRVPVTVALGRETPDRGVPIRYSVPAAILGVTLGWLLRPAPFETARLLDVQLVQLFSQKAVSQPLTFAAELSPASLVEIGTTSWLFLGVWLLGLAAAVRFGVKGRLEHLGQERATLLFSALVISAVFFALTLLSARRAMEQWIAFGFLALPVIGSMAIPFPFRSVRGLGIAALLLAHLTWGAGRHLLNVDLVAFPVTTLRDVSYFLEANSAPGEVVFHAHWDNFGPLFAYNRTNRYLGGMDPIFQYAHDPQAFWEFFYLSTDVTTEWTCDAYPCVDGVATDTHVALREHFGARWVVVEPRRNPRLSLFLLNDDRFDLALETQREAIFEVLPVSDGR
jgi:hypothetical protein